MGKSKAGKSEVECDYCRIFGHTMWNCKSCASNLLKGKLKESTNIAIDEYPSDLDDGNDFDEGMESQTFLEQERIS